MRTKMIAVAVAVLAAGCATEVGRAGGGGESVDPSTSVTEQTATTEPDESEDDHGLPRPSELATDLGRQPSGPVGQDIEMAFVGRVVAIDEGGSRPWITFDVERWFSDAIGPRVGLWARGFDAAVGEDWLVASTRHHEVTGDVLPDESVLLDDATLAAWEERYDGSVDPNGGTPESPADPDVVAAIEEGRNRWAATEPPAWTATIRRWERGDEYGECGSGPVRTVVRDGEVVEAFDLDAECDVADPVTMAEVFDLAERWAGAARDGPTFDEQYGWVEMLWADDRSVEAEISVDDFVPEARPIARDPQDEALADARRRWDAAGIDDYHLVVEPICFCGFQGPVDVEVVDGVAVAPEPADPEMQAADYDGLDLTIDAIFTQIADAIQSGDVDVSYDPDLGYPTWAFLDYIVDGADDEMEYVVSSLAPTG